MILKRNGTSVGVYETQPMMRRNTNTFVVHLNQKELLELIGDLATRSREDGAWLEVEADDYSGNFYVKDAD